MKHLTISLLIGLGLVLGGCAGAEKAKQPAAAERVPVTVTRDQVVESLCSRMVVGMRLHLEMSAEEQQKAISDVQALMKDVASEIAQETYTADSAEIVEAVLPEYVVVNETDPKFNRLYVEKVLRDVKIGFDLAHRIQPVSEQERAEIAANVEMLSEGLQALTSKRLDWIIEPDELNAYLAGIQGAVMNTIDDPVRPAFKDAATEEQVRALIDGADKTITEKEEEFKRRLERAMATNDPERLPINLETVRRSVLVDVCYQPFQQLEELTTQKDMVGLEPADLDPVYPFIYEKLKTRGEELGENRLRDTSERP